MRKIARINSLELEEDMAFQKLEWTMERIGWIFLTLVAAAMLAGYFGKGPVSETAAGDEKGPLWIRYERFGRWQTRTTLEVHAAPSDFDKKVRLSVNEGYLKEMRLEQITPEPESVEARADKTTFTFAAGERNERLLIKLHVEPEQWGRKSGRLELPDRTVSFQQLVYP
jgi:hypothetical protein